MNLLRHPALRFVRLPALLAVLLLATLPTLGRLQATTSMAGMHATKVALCTVSGLRSIQLELAPSHDATTPVAPEHHQHDDCAYCPLLAGLVQLAVTPALYLPPPDASKRPHARTTTRITSVANTGLGARGPPYNFASITT
ncbi:MAG: DUF2946 family protein [Proteobacteria bacterium]|nr:DUF2946 family protein [Pseudomonadota bacterium]